MTQIIRISKENINAVTGTAPDNLIFSSDYNTLKYYTSGTVNVTVNAADAEGTVSHNLGYYPWFTALVNYFADPNGTAFSMCPGSFKDVGNYLYANAYAGTDNLYFQIRTNASINTFTFRYFIFRNNLGL